MWSVECYYLLISLFKEYALDEMQHNFWSREYFSVGNSFWIYLLQKLLVHSVFADFGIGSLVLKSVRCKGMRLTFVRCTFEAKLLYLSSIFLIKFYELFCQVSVVRHASMRIVYSAPPGLDRVKLSAFAWSFIGFDYKIKMDGLEKLDSRPYHLLYISKTLHISSMP